MATVRLQIVEAIAEAMRLATGLVVHRNLDYALEDTRLPAIALTSLEDAPAGGGQIAAMRHECHLAITVLVSRAVANPEQEADAIEAQIHAALYGAQDFAGHSVVVERVVAGWTFDQGDSAQRELRYNVAFTSALTDLEAAT